MVKIMIGDNHKVDLVHLLPYAHVHNGRAAKNACILGEVTLYVSVHSTFTQPRLYRDIKQSTVKS